MGSLDYWRQCDELTIVQAALLIVGENPSPRLTCVGGWSIEDRPPRYEAALSLACISKDVDGKCVAIKDHDINGNFIEWLDGTVDVVESTVLAADLKNWLRSRGIKTGFFFPEGEEAPGFLDKDHPRYAQKLAAAVSAWLAIDTESNLGGKSPMQALVRWLRENSAEFGLADDEGKLNETGIEECAKVANWQEHGGAPRTQRAITLPPLKGNPSTAYRSVRYGFRVRMNN